MLCPKMRESLTVSLLTPAVKGAAFEKILYPQITQMDAD
jgi:hypothetical protein